MALETYELAEAEYFATLNYDLNGSRTEALRHAGSIRALMRHEPEVSQKGNERVERRLETASRELDRAISFSRNGSVRFAQLGNSRG